RQVAFPEQEGHLLERHLLRQVGDHVALVDKPAVGAVDHRDRRLRADDPLEARYVGGRHRLASCSGFLPGSGPVQRDAGGLMRRSDSDSRTCAVQPAPREMAYTEVKSPFGMPSPFRTTEAPESKVGAL